MDNNIPTIIELLKKEKSLNDVFKQAVIDVLEEKGGSNGIES